MNSKLTLIISFLVLNCFISFSQDGCREVLIFAARNISAESTTTVLANTIYHQYTTSDNKINTAGFSFTSTETTDLIKSIFNIKGQNEMEVVKSFRAWYEDQSFQQNDYLGYDNNAVQEALGAWKACRKLKNEQLEFGIQEANKLITFTMSNSGEPIKFMGAKYDKEELTCLLQSPNRKKAIKVKANTREDLQSGVVYSMVCTRNQIENDSMKFYPLTDISITTSKGALTLKIPEKVSPSRKWLTDVSSEIEMLKRQLEEDKAQLKYAIFESGNSLRQELFRHKDILIGYYDHKEDDLSSEYLKTNKILTNLIDSKNKVMWFNVNGNRAQIPNDNKYQIFLLSGANEQHVIQAMKGKKHPKIEINGYKGEQLVFIAFRKRKSLE